MLVKSKLHQYPNIPQCWAGKVQVHAKCSSSPLVSFLSCPCWSPSGDHVGSLVWTHHCTCSASLILTFPSTEPTRLSQCSEPARGPTESSESSVLKAWMNGHDLMGCSFRVTQKRMFYFIQSFIHNVKQSNVEASGLILARSAGFLRILPTTRGVCAARPWSQPCRGPLEVFSARGHLLRQSRSYLSPSFSF